MGSVNDFLWELKNKSSEWKWDAACQGMGPEIFYLEPYQTADNDRRLQEARQVCGKCLVRVECLRYALDNCIGTGIWAGTTPAQRKKLRHERAS